METALFMFVMKFDLNLNTNPLLSIESRFTRENTNDLGEPIIPQVSHIIISEFKKFMYLNAIAIGKCKRDDNLKQEDNYIRNKKWFHKSPFVAPPYLDRIWKLFILYNQNYEEF